MLQLQLNEDINMTKTKTVTQSDKSSYSEDYKRIRNDAERNWPEWKIVAYNETFAVSKHAKKLTVSK